MKKQYFILAIIFCLFMIPKNVFAATVSAEPFGFRVNNSEGTSTDLALSYGTHHSIPIYFYNFSSAVERNNVQFVFHNQTVLNNNQWTLSFYIYTSLITTYSVPLTAFVLDTSGNVTACQGQVGRTFEKDVVNGYSNDFVSFVCPNTVVSSEYRVNIVGTGVYNSVGISKLTFSRDISIAVLNSNLINQNNILKSQNDEIKKQTEETKKQNEFLNDDNVDDSKDKASNFFNNFEENNHGLSGLINSPISLLQNLTTATCTPLSFKLPMVEQEVSLPCLKPIYKQYFGVFFTLYQMMTTGLISYAVGIRLFAKIKGLQDPQNDKIEVFNL